MPAAFTPRNILQKLKHLEILLHYVYDLELFGGLNDGYSKNIYFFHIFRLALKNS